MRCIKICPRMLRQHSTVYRLLASECCQAKAPKLASIIQFVDVSFALLQSIVRRQSSAQWTDVTLHNSMQCTRASCKICSEILTPNGQRLYTDAFTQRHAFVQDAFTHGGFCTEMLFTKTSFYIHMYAHTDAFARGACTHKNAFTQRCFYTVMFLHEGTFTRRYAGTSTHRCFYTGMLFHRNVFTHMCFYTGILLTQSSVYTQKLLHAYTLAQRCFYTEIYTFTQRCFLHRCVYTEAFLHGYFCTEMLLHTGAFRLARF